MEQTTLPSRRSSRSLSSEPLNASLQGAVARDLPHRSRRRGNTLFAWLLLAPSLVLLGALVVYPIGRTIVESVVVQGHLGFGNYSFAVTDPSFGSALKNTLIWGAAAMLVVPTMGLVGAALVEDGPVKHKAIWRFCFFAPYLLSLAATGVVFVQALDPVFGLVHGVLSVIGLGSVQVNWLGNPSDVLWIGIVLFAWNQAPFCFLVMSSAIRQIDRDMYDAALLDGATRLARFRYVTMPMLRWVTRSLRFIMLIAGLTPFAVLFVLVTSNSATQIIPTLIYNYGMEGTNQGEAGAVSAMFAAFLACLVITFSRFLMRGRKSDVHK